ncbi:MAG: hypothetical protein IKX51_05190 [Bacteroidales bacterium]|nr:hypothetical protein [Bacteroidales bacterium]
MRKIAIIFSILLLAASCCVTRQRTTISSESRSTQTNSVSHRADTVKIHYSDTLLVFINGDTVIIHDKSTETIRETKYRTDTVTVHDTLMKDDTRTETVTEKVTDWKSTLILTAILTLILTIAILIIWKRLRK